MSFVNLMDDVLFTEHEIVARTEAMVHAVVPQKEELILGRKLQGVASGVYTLTAEEEALFQKLRDVGLTAQEVGIQARADNALKQQALAYEAAQRRLAQPEYDGPTEQVVVDEEGNETTVEHPAYVRDQAERAEAQATIDGASEAVIQLVAEREAYRNPPEPEPDEGEMLGEGWPA